MECRAHEMGGSPCAASLVGICAAFVLSPAFAGLENLSCLDTWGFARKAEFLSKVVYAKALGGDLMSVDLGSVFESDPLNYLDHEFASFQLVPLLFGHFR